MRGAEPVDTGADAGVELASPPVHRSAPGLPTGGTDRFSLLVAGILALVALGAWWSGRDRAHPLRNARALDVCAQAEAVGIAELWAGRQVAPQALAADPKRGQAGGCRFRDVSVVPETLLGDLSVSTMASLADSDSVHSQDAMVRHLGMLEWERGVRIGQPGAPNLHGPWRQAVRFDARRPGEAVVILVEDHGIFLHWRGDARLDPAAVEAFLARLTQGLRAP